MKKAIAFILFVVLTLMLLCACANVDDNTSGDDSSVPDAISNDQLSETDNTSAPESVPDISEESCEESSENLPEESSEDENYLWKGDLERHYPDDLCDIYLLSKLRTWDEIYAWEETTFLIQSSEEMDQLPTMYQAVKGLNISREDFERVNAEQIAFNKERGTEQSTYTDKQIEYMFGDYDEKEIKLQLKKASTYYYEGRVYTVYELLRAEDALLIEMIQKGELEEFLALLEKHVKNFDDLAAVQKLQEKVRSNK